MKFLIALCTFALAYAANPDCRLEPETGLCRGYFPRFYYDPEDGTCKKFIYGGCGGNGNSFGTEEECMEECKGTEPEEQYSPDPVAICHLKPERGMCLGYFPRYFYNAETRKCEKFVYGGCQGNPNNFKTLEECEQTCVKPEEQFSEVPICEQPAESGNCLGFMPRYYYDKEEGKCKRFIYGGCGGNENNFKTLKECEQECGVAYSESTCQQEKKTGPCRAYFPRYYYDSEDGVCKKFIYGGCQGNDNNFETQEECELTCASSAPVDCTSEPETGMCRGYFPRYFYDQTTQSCKKFVYGGCGGNGNNYETEEECLRTCA